MLTCIASTAGSTRCGLSYTSWCVVVCVPVCWLLRWVWHPREPYIRWRYMWASPGVYDWMICV